METIYAIGDIHGQLAELQHVLSLIEADGGQDARIVFLGDYTDRGPDSKGVIELLVQGLDSGRPWTCLKGNHDRMFQLFLKSPPQYDPYLMVELYWLHPRLGGDTTLASYGVDASGMRREKDVHADILQAIPGHHVDFLSKLRLTHESEKLFFAHAGIRPGVSLEAQTEEDLIWIRKEFHQAKDSHPKLIVHGHTPVNVATHYGNRINLDSGAGYGNPLTAVVFEGETCHLLTEKGRVPLLPTA